jgi:peptide/nickel transport system permease protein
MTGLQWVASRAGRGTDVRNYILKRLLLMAPTLVGVTLLTATLTRLVPGDALAVQFANTPQYRQEDLQGLRQQMGLDRPFPEQYGRFLWGAVRGDLGHSLWSDRPVREEIGRRLPVTVELAALAVLISTGLALVLGVLAAARQNTLVDYLVRSVTALGLSVPNFVLGTLLVLLPALWLGYLMPLSYIPLDQDPLGNLRQFLVPALALGLPLSAGILRLVRSSLLEVLREDYVRTARAKGLGERTVIVRHVLRNALIPVLTMAGQQLSYLLGGAVLVESIFQLPGVGRLALESVLQRDYPMLQGTVLFSAVVFLVLNLLVDLSYAWLDPRITY